MSNEKIYCGNARLIKTKFGEITKISFHKADINKMGEWIKANGGDWVNIAIYEKKAPEQGKHTHYGVIDEWKPEVKQEKVHSINQEYSTSDLIPEDEIQDLPF